MIEEKHALTPNQRIDNYADYLCNFTISRVNNSDLAKDLLQKFFKEKQLKELGWCLF